MLGQACRAATLCDLALRSAANRYCDTGTTLHDIHRMANSAVRHYIKNKNNYIVRYVKKLYLIDGSVPLDFFNNTIKIYLYAK